MSLMPSAQGAVPVCEERLDKAKRGFSQRHEEDHDGMMSTQQACFTKAKAHAPTETVTG